MLKWDDNHYPANNARLIDMLLDTEEPLEKITEETQQLFNQIYQPIELQTNKQKKTLQEKFWSLISTDFTIDDNKEIGFQTEGNQICPYWKTELDRQYDRLQKVTGNYISVTQFGARGDGKTDSTAAFKLAFGNGGKKVFVPEGVYLVKGLKLPSWTLLVGAGKGRTVIRLHDDAPRRRTLLANKNPISGNRNISVEGLTLDWNIERLKPGQKSATGNNFSSCLTYANVQNGWVKNVEAINPGLHCFDISSSFYSYAGDGTKAKGGSSSIWLDQVTGYGFGDDGVTTHHSDYIFISNSHFRDPGGRSHKEGFSNSNGFEIDDGSRNVWLANNSSTRCFGGVEIKAHATSSAAAGVHISGHLSVNDNRAFNFRHIGHHHKDDEESKSAYSITAQKLVAIHPVHTELYKNSSPRALVISGYRNVAVNRFLFAGNPNYDYRNETVASIQFRAANVALANGRIQGFRSVKTDLTIASGEKNVRNVVVQNVHSYHSASELLDLGKDDSTVQINNILRAET
ncbi:glycosyl hydrolase family 28-related protein [Planomicrobium okeanokoites]|uniref:glycosyl hydrolase family 28-related protein n=1 Tax=Planomicrobium okeanokoites TaxID=244 RepID=UPI0030F8A44F